MTVFTGIGRAGIGVLCSLLLAACATVAPSPSPGSIPTIDATVAPATTEATAPTTTSAPTPTEEPTQEPTEEATPSAEPTAASTPEPATPEPTTPGGSLPPVGATIFSDDMSGDPTFLSVGSQPDFGSSEYVDGVYRITSEPRPGFVNYTEGGSTEGCSGETCEFPEELNNQLETSSVEVDVTLVSGAADGTLGIGCAFTGTGVIGGFVGATISSDGRRYALAQNSAPGDVPLDHLFGGADHGEPNPAINQGSGATNHLRADCGEQAFSFWVNDTLVASGSLPEPLGEIDFQRGVAIFAAAGAEESVTVEFDNLVVSELPAEPVPAPASGTTIYSDPLSDPTPAWPTGEFEVASAQFEDGAYVIRPTAGNRAAVFPTTMVSPADVVVQVDVEFESAPELTPAGVQCRGSSTGWYAGEIRADGMVSIAQEVAGGTERLVDWTPSSAVQTGTATNTVRLECVGDQLTLFVNDEEVAETSDSDLQEWGGAGFQTTSPEGASDGDVVARFTNYLTRHA